MCKKEIKVCYSIRNNLGNALNPFIIEDILGRKVVWADEYNCETSGIGSGLRLFFRRPHLIRNRQEIPQGIRPSQIWSAGFLTTPSKDVQPIKQLLISSVRGKLSKEILEKIYGNQWDIKVGDAGLLASELIREKLYKKHTLGIIPHDRERDELKYQELHRKLKNSIIIDVRGNPLEIVKTIAECECVVSSSLHGLVVADSFNIPNKWVKLTNNILGDGFKFHDYYSAFNLKEHVLDLNLVDTIDIDRIKADYQVTSTIVNKLKDEIMKSFETYI